MVKWFLKCYSFLWKPHLRATEHHLPHGITQCYPTQVSMLCFNSAARLAGTWFTYPGGMEGWVDRGVGYIPRCGCVALLSARGRARQPAQADRQQDRVCSARLCTWPGRELWRSTLRGDRGQTVQSVHVQLCTQIHEHGRTASRARLSALHQGRVRNCPTKVRIIIGLVVFYEQDRSKITFLATPDKLQNTKFFLYCLNDSDLLTFSSLGLCSVFTDGIKIIRFSCITSDGF